MKDDKDTAPQTAKAQDAKRDAKQDVKQPANPTAKQDVKQPAKPTVKAEPKLGARAFPTKAEIQGAIASSLGADAIERRVLIERSQGMYGYTSDELKDRSCESLNSRLKAITGIVINEMTASGALLFDDTAGVYTLPKSADDSDDEAEGVTLSKSKRRRERRKRAAIKRANDLPKYPDSPVGNLLMGADGEYVKFKDGKISEVNYMTALKRYTLKCISAAGGEFFERLSMEILLACYGTAVVKNELTAGSADNGVDGKIYIVDSLGFDEVIFFQSKTKLDDRAYVSIKQVREFYGVMHAYGANKGIVISNANYFKDTRAFAQKLNDLMLIDANSLFDLMVKHSVGIISRDGVRRIDEQLFLNV